MPSTARALIDCMRMYAHVCLDDAAPLAFYAGQLRGFVSLYAPCSCFDQAHLDLETILDIHGLLSRDALNT
jgi:hypothetical protein